MKTIENEIIIHPNGNTYCGELACRFATGSLKLPAVFKLTGNERFMVFEVDAWGAIVHRASQSTKELAAQYMGVNRVMVYREDADGDTVSISAMADRIIVETCRNMDGSTKCQLIRQKVTNPLTVEQFGEWRWQVWKDWLPGEVQLCRDEARAREVFAEARIYGNSDIHNC